MAWIPWVRRPSPTRTRPGFRAAGWWTDLTLSDAVRRNAEHSPDRPAYIDHPDTVADLAPIRPAATVWPVSWPGRGVARGDRVAVWHGDSTAIHVLFVAIERCGAVVVGIGARAGTREVAAILRNSRAEILISDP